jgi:hypothetical protein
MGRLSRTVLGRVLTRHKSEYFTLLLERGNRIKVRLHFKPILGDKCNVCVCRSTGKILKVLEYSEDGVEGTTPITKREDMPSPEELATDVDVEIEGECFLGEQSFEDLEIEELESLEWESSRDTEM